MSSKSLNAAKDTEPIPNANMTISGDGRVGGGRRERWAVQAKGVGWGRRGELGLWEGVNGTATAATLLQTEVSLCGPRSGHVKKPDSPDKGHLSPVSPNRATRAGPVGFQPKPCQRLRKLCLRDFISLPEPRGKPPFNAEGGVRGWGGGLGGGRGAQAFSLQDGCCCDFLR